VARSGAGVANLIEISANNSSAKKHRGRTNLLLVFDVTYCLCASSFCLSTDEPLLVPGELFDE
jgi:hypothetical protein